MWINHVSLVPCAEHLPAILPEYAVSHTIHLLSHHPNFSRTNPQALDNFRE